MTKRDILKTALKNIQPQKTPYFIYFTDEAREQYADRLFHDFAEKKVIQDYSAGRIGPFEAISLAIGNYVHRFSPPWWNWFELPEEYSRSHATPGYLPKTIGTGSYEKFIDHIKYIRDNYDVYILVSIYGCHFEKAYGCRGLENFLADIGTEPEFVSKLLGKIIQKNLVMIENIVAHPEIDGILLGSDWGTQKSLFMSPGTWEEFIAPGEQAEFDLINEYGKDVWIHSCGNIAPLIPRLIEMGMRVLNPVQPECMDIYDLKNKYGDKITFWGGISTQITLPYGSPDDVKAETKHVIGELGKNGGYITSPAQDIQHDVPYENIISLLEVAIEG